MIRRDISIAALALVLAGCSDPSRGVPIFLWHAVGVQCAPAPYAVPTAEFARELDDLQKWGATPITLSQLFDAREGKGALPARPVVLTFDDGRDCQYTEALPLLKQRHMVAETFVTVAYLREAPPLSTRYVEHEGDKTYGYLTWPELLEMASSGAFEVESHGLGHNRLPRLSAPEQARELELSRQVLAFRLKRPIEFFAYPFGSSDRSSRALVEKIGYRGAVAVQSGWGGRWAMKRVSLHAGDEPALLAALRSAFGAPKAP